VSDISYLTKPDLEESDLQRLFVAAWGAPKGDFRPVLTRNFTWVGAFSGSALIGFVNVAWDGGVHFFMLDTTVHPSWRRQGIGGALVREAVAACRGHGEWIHVDSDEELMAKFYEPAGFQPTAAGLLWVA
jgi:ribosomal protein S18 acetylase RimI-like enzyme